MIKDCVQALFLFGMVQREVLSVGLFLMHVYVPPCMCMHKYVCGYQWRAEAGIVPFGARRTGIRCGCQDPKSSPLIEQLSSLTAEASLSSDPRE